LHPPAFDLLIDLFPARESICLLALAHKYSFLDAEPLTSLLPVTKLHSFLFALISPPFYTDYSPTPTPCSPSLPTTVAVVLSLGFCNRIKWSHASNIRTVILSRFPAKFSRVPPQYYPFSSCFKGVLFPAVCNEMSDLCVPPPPPSLLPLLVPRDLNKTRPCLFFLFLNDPRDHFPRYLPQRTPGSLLSFYRIAPT